MKNKAITPLREDIIQSRIVKLRKFTQCVSILNEEQNKTVLNKYYNAIETITRRKQKEN